MRHEASDRQSVLLNGSNDEGGFELLAELPRKYLQAYAFAGVFG